MSVKLHKKEDELPGISVLEMEDGQLAEVLSWSDVPGGKDMPGEIVQRYGDTALIRLGGRSGLGCRFLFCECGKEAKERIDRDCRVRLLEPGELIKVVDN